MEKELVELFDSAKKAADAAAAGDEGGAEETRCIEALKELKKFPVTTQVLVATQVGKRLRHLTKHPTEKIQAVAADLLNVWKKIVMEESSAKNKKNGSIETKITKSESYKTMKVDKSGSVNVEKISRSETTKVEKTDHISSAKVSRSETVKIEIKSESRKGVDKSNGVKQAPASSTPPKFTSMIKCNDAVRDKVREILAEALSKVHTEANGGDILDKVNTCDPIRVAVSVESVLFEKWGLSNGAKKFKYRSIMFNIKDPKNPDFRRRVLIGEIKPERLVNMTPEEMASDQRKEETNQIKEKALFYCERSGEATATTDQFKCGRCKQRKTTYYQMQTRSADEPMTTYVTCVNCNNHWKFC
ncbi:hypothetical protein MKW94_023189 [Papaver nudicaule]|uniref:Transcription elongation factor n=1 Tax=Papaver nudicaule TaxID=74823 RepID=A0AA42AXX7_PAPNU|nr:hypothetical protein [Papaver nudicaule]